MFTESSSFSLTLHMGNHASFPLVNGVHSELHVWHLQLSLPLHAKLRVARATAFVLLLAGYTGVIGKSLQYIDITS